MTHIWLSLAHLAACSGEFTPSTTGTFTVETSTTSVTTETGTYTTTETAPNTDADGDGFIGTDFGGDDCDDTDPNTHPLASDTTLTDRNCDGVHETDLARADYRFLGTSVYDKAGSALGPAGDVDGDGLDDILITAIFAGKKSNGEVYLIHGKDLNDLGYYQLDDAAVIISGVENEYASEAVNDAGDLDSDGLGDVLIGSPYNNEVAYLSGKAVIFLGKSLPEQGQRLLVDADISIFGTEREQYVGQAVAGANDIDGDGVDDLLVGAYNYDDGRGSVALFSGGTLSAGSYAFDDADTVLEGDNEGASAGYKLDNAGDVDGDGRSDLLIGAPNFGMGGDDTGWSFLVYASTLDGVSAFNLEDANHTFRGNTAGDYSGRALSTAGDVDNDGKADLLIDARNASDTFSYGGSGYLFLGANLSESGTHLLSDSDYIFTSEGPDHFTAFSVADAGDIDANGHDDILIGAISADGESTEKSDADAGRVYIVYGETLGDTREIPLAEASHILIGEYGQDRAGTTLSRAGDVDGDGFSDFMVGAEQFDHKKGDEGKVYLIMGAAQLK